MKVCSVVAVFRKESTECGPDAGHVEELAWQPLLRRNMVFEKEVKW